MTEDRGIFVVVASTVPVLVLRLGTSLLRMGFRARRGASTFKRQLRKSGVHPDLARKLASRYRQQWSLRKLISFAMKQARN